MSTEDKRRSDRATVPLSVPDRCRRNRRLEKACVSQITSAPTQLALNMARAPQAPGSGSEIFPEVPSTPPAASGASTAGAPSPWGMGGATVSNGNGTAANTGAYGAGGGGAASTGASSYVGGAGAPGAIVVRW